MRTCRLAVFASVVLIGLLARVAAQEPQPPAQEKPKPKLSVRFVAYDGARPAFYPLADSDSMMGAVIKDFKRLSSTPWNNFPQVETLTMLLGRDGARARVSVFIPSETEGYPESGKIAECLLDEGGQCLMTQMLAYGIEPFNVSVVRRVETKLSPPKVSNRMRGVEVTSVEVREAVPSFELTLRNVSGKWIRAVNIEAFREWQSRGSPPSYEWKKMSLIKPDGEWKIYIEFGWNLKTEDGAHAVEPPDRIEIKSVLYSDGSYEGDGFFAVRAEALTAGRGAQLARIIEVLRECEGEPAVDAREGARQLAAKVEALEHTSDWPAVVELAGRFNLSSGNVMDEVKSAMEEGMELERAAALVNFRRFASSVRAEVTWNTFAVWLKGQRETYERALTGYASKQTQ